MMTTIASFLILWAAQDPAPPAYQPPPAPNVGEWPRERLAAFLDDLANFVYDKHVVRDERRKVFGMTYEFARDGKQMQEFLLDAMHDGAWFTSAMLSAHRARPAGKYLERIQTYQVPFYLNVLHHSDRLFPNMQRTDEDRKPYAAPLKGWIP